MRTTIVTAILITVAAGLLGFATPADAFCVYNDADKPVKFYTGSGHGAHFNSQWLDPGKNSCCHWSNVMCNGSKEQKRLVTMTVIVWMPAGGGLGFHPDLNCGHFQFEAGGYLKAARNGPHYIVRAFNINNSLRSESQCKKDGGH